MMDGRNFWSLDKYTNKGNTEEFKQRQEKIWKEE